MTVRLLDDKGLVHDADTAAMYVAKQRYNLDWCFARCRSSVLRLVLTPQPLTTCLACVALGPDDKVLP